MIQLKAIDVGIGIAFCYLLLTFVAGAIVELLSALRNWRGRILRDAIENMLAGSRLVCLADIYDNPLIIGLGQNRIGKSLLHPRIWLGWERIDRGNTSQFRRLPSYIPAATFSAAVLEKLLDSARTIVLSPDGAIEWLRSLICAERREDKQEGMHAGLRQGDALRSILETTLVTQGASIQSVRFAIEKWFNDTMGRTSGWYKRRTQSYLLIFGLFIAFGADISSVSLAHWLWNGDAARQAVVSAASDYARNHPTQPKEVENNLSTSKDFASNIVSTEKLFDLGCPIGWNRLYLKERDVFFWVLEYVSGCIITALAVSMGSSFWFDALQSLIKIRGAGSKPS